MNLSNEIVLYKKNENQEFLQFKKLLKYSDIINHAYSVGIDKNYRTFKANRTSLSLEEYEKNMNNYKLLCNAIGLNYKNLIKANQAHTDNIVKIDTINNDRIDTVNPSDGLVTNKKKYHTCNNKC